jgi:hypothetical protein
MYSNFIILTSPFPTPNAEQSREYMSVECGHLFVIDNTPSGILRVRWCDIVLMVSVLTGVKISN